MSSLIPIQKDIDDISFAVQAQLAELPQEAQQDFLNEFHRRKKELPAAYLAHLTTLSEGYLDNWTLQILFWLSIPIGLGPLWWTINLFRMPGKVKRYNRTMATKVLKYIHYKHQIIGKGKLQSLKGKIFEKPSSIIRTKPVQVTPRPWKSSEPQTMSLENAGSGTILDYGLETWEIVHEGQYDWEDGTSEKIFGLNQVGDVDGFLLLVRKEFGHLSVQKAQPVNIYAINEGLEMEVMERKRPFNVLHYQGVAYYREYSKTGYMFNLMQKSPAGTELIAWTYYDEERKRVIRIERHGEADFKAYTGTVVSPLDFSEIMNNKGD